MSHKKSVRKQNIKAIILAGSRDFGRCPLASRLPTALWPVIDRPVLERLLRYLSHQGIKQATVCSNGDASLLQRSITGVNSMQMKFLDEPLPTGTAGCIRDAVDGDTNALFLVFHAGITSPPNIDMLIQTHRTAKSDLTVMFDPDSENGEPRDHTSEIYICEPTVLKYIPEEGYCDIKEGLISTMLREGGTVYAARLSQPTGNFRTRDRYLAAIATYLENSSNGNADFPYSKWNGSKNVWLAGSAKVDSDARIYGPVVIMDNATISEKAVVFGPTIVGRNVVIGKNAFVENSVLWDGSSIGQNCEIHSCVVDCNALVRNNSLVEDEAVTYKQNGKFKIGVNNAASLVSSKAGQLHSAARPLLDRIGAKLPAWVRSDKLKSSVLRGLGISIIVGVFLWSYWAGLVDLWNIWQRSDEYSSGALVPFLAVYILWSRRRDIARCRLKPSVWGLFAFIAAQGVRLFGLFFMYGSAERLSIALSIAALVLLLFGWQFFRKVSTILLFLCLMLPWPNRVQAAVAMPLQRWATSSAVFCLEMLGYAVIRDGNIIQINDTSVAVAEACNGLRMITAFFVISGLVILLVKRAWWEKLLVLASSLPIALLCNTVRLVITTIAFTVLSGEQWEQIFHDFGGYAMMPLALGAVVAELWLLAKLVTVPAKEEAIIITQAKPVVSIINRNERSTKK